MIVSKLIYFFFQLNHIFPPAPPFLCPFQVVYSLYNIYLHSFYLFMEETYNVPLGWIWDLKVLDSWFKEIEIYPMFLDCYCCSVTKSCLTLWLHGLHHARLPCPLPPLEFTQVHVNWIRDAIQPSRTLGLEELIVANTAIIFTDLMWSTWNAGDTRDASSIPGSRRSPGGGNGNSF